jgi:hypothetical protein
MAEINPYEPPNTPPSKVVATTKKGLAFATLAVLTPIAVVIAGCCSCLAVYPALDLVDSQTRGLDEENGIAMMFFAGWGVFLIPPLVVLIVMGRWAIRAYNREVEEHNAKLKRSKISE